jgi:citrate lyase beta subunit
MEDKGGDWVSYREALEHAHAIATASARTAGLIFGIGDYTPELGVDPDLLLDRQDEIFYYEKKAVVTAAKAAGLHTIDNAYPRIWSKDDGEQVIAEVEAPVRRKNE